MLSSHKPRTVAETLANGVEILSSIEDGRSGAQVLLGFILGRDRGWILAHGETFLSRAQAEKYVELCRKRAAGVPVAYITGFAGFYGREFSVNEHVLIPRPETELLAEDAVAHLRSLALSRAPAVPVLTVFEAGIGSGAIGCTILAEVPQAALEGSDISTAALKVADYNARRLNVYGRCKFYAADVVKPNLVRSYDLVVANLPYIPSNAVPQKPNAVGYEPRIALDGGPDGLDHYRILLTHLPRMLRPGALVLMEAAPPTIGLLARLTRAALPQAQVEIRHDYAGLERYVWVLAASP